LFHLVLLHAIQGKKPKPHPSRQDKRSARLMMVSVAPAGFFGFGPASALLLPAWRPPAVPFLLLDIGVISIAAN